MFKSTDTHYLSREILGSLGVKRLSRSKSRLKLIDAYDLSKCSMPLKTRSGYVWNVKEMKRLKPGTNKR